MTLQARARSLQTEFEALQVEADGSTRVPPALRREIVDLALDVLNEGGEKGRAGAPRVLAMLTRKPS